MSQAQGQHLLDDIRVLDLTHYEAGPTCTLLLGFFGAEVIKIESPTLGKPNRHLFYGMEGNEDLYFVLLNLNKKSITLDIKSKKGRMLFNELIKKSDVLVENFGIQKMTKWGFSEEALNRCNPQLVYASITGYGSYGPYASYPSLDMTAQAMSGIMSITGNPDDPPLRCGATVADSSGGTNLALGIVAALYRREKTGKGMRVEVSLQDSAVSLGRSLLGTHIAFGSQTPKFGNQLKDVVPWDIYRSKDGGFVAICVIDQSGFEKLMHAIGKTEILEKFELDSLQQRKKARDLVEKTVGDWVADRTKQDVMKILCEQGIPCGAILDTLEIADDPHLNQREMLVEITHPQWGRVKVLGCPVKFSDFHNEIKSSPEFGKHNQEIYSGLLNLSETKIQELKQTGVI
ncbi:MAG: CoA transferase [Desulfobacterales bacterium]|jgi:crotonobetainyl-CoA:carnitine CoA-transferase CaiB-like acyl-CoA transferase